MLPLRGKKNSSIALFIEFLKRRQEISDGVHHIVGHQAAVGRQLTIPVLLGLLNLRHASESEHCVEATVRPEQHVCL